ncbi:MAG: hypothetical protein JF632_09035 [Acidobacteria bacterium]|nr:hypothetical protein [Acidobacteriota bacterium]
MADERDHVVRSGMAAHLDAQVARSFRPGGKQQASHNGRRHQAPAFDIHDHVALVEGEHEMRKRTGAAHPLGNRLGDGFVRRADVTIRRAHRVPDFRVRHRRKLACRVRRPREQDDERTRENA